ncbi:MAG: Formamidopyrimidine-DNA glycosylase [Microgenomates group bacterium Gr01-1014_5]|nr:MAG: Formamidopyrimidine-DNA glycosylase [Microgenomates group bacterium Gr01-1014_5]
MPELPEVETIRLGLERYVVGKKIVEVEVRLKKILQGDITKITGAKFKKIRRFGKALSLDLDNNYSIAIHVKMTGQLIWVSDESKVSRVSKAVGQLPNKFTHVIFKLDKGSLYYNDIRQFGWLKIISTSDVEQMPFVRELGPEPPIGNRDGEREILTPEKFKQIVSGKNTKIKVLLMDQKRIGGVGNIYANDALFLAGIDPRRQAKSLSTNETKKLYQSIEEVLKQGLKYGGSSEFTYVNVLGETGEYQKYFLVYGFYKKPCSRCGGKISTMKIGGRGTFFCPHCQI